MMLHSLAPLLLCATAHGAIYSQYSLDGPTVTDTFGLTNSTKEIVLGSGDNAVCGSSYHMKAGDFISLGSSNGAPTGNVDFSVGGYVKPVTLAQRALFAIGGNFKDNDGSVGNWGAWVLVDSKGALSVRTLKLNQKSSATIVVGKWSQVLLTYTASETMLRLWVDGVLALSHEVTMDLRKNSRYGGMAIGEFHLGGSPWGRGGEYFMDHVSFANTVLASTDARAPCVGIYSQYSLDGPTVTDTFGLTNSTKEIVLGSGDNAVCGSSYHMKAGDFINLGSSNGAPTGNVDFSVGGYVKPVTLAQRALFAIGGNFKDNDGSVGNWGAWVLVDSKGALSVRTLKLNQKSSATIVVGKWSQVLLTYTASETMLRLWVDGVLALSHEVTMDLRKNSRYGGMAIGEFHLGGSPWGRGGEYFMDHVSFANTVLASTDARAPCLSYTSNARPTSAPPTSAPTTDTPSTSAPLTPAPLTDAPATSVPPSSAPKTDTPATSAPSTLAPLTDAPPTSAPTNELAPLTDAPAASVPPSSAPTTDTPATSAPLTPAPLTDAPATSVRPSSASTTDTPATSAPSTRTPTAPATLAAPGTVMVVKELLRIALGVLFSLFDADTFLADLLAFLSEQVTSGKLRWTCPESACVNGCPATSALKIAAECNSHDSSVARNAQLLASGNVVVEFEPEYAEGNSADTVKLALDREAAAPTTLAKYYVGAVDVVQSEVVIVHVDDSDGNDDLQAGYIVLIVAMVIPFLIVVVITVVYFVTRKNKQTTKEKYVPTCTTSEVEDNCQTDYVQEPIL